MGNEASSELSNIPPIENEISVGWIEESKTGPSAREGMVVCFILFDFLKALLDVQLTTRSTYSVVVLKMILVQYNTMIYGDMTQVKRSSSHL